MTDKQEHNRMIVSLGSILADVPDRTSVVWLNDAWVIGPVVDFDIGGIWYPDYVGISAPVFLFDQKITFGNLSVYIAGGIEVTFIMRDTESTVA